MRWDFVSFGILGSVGAAMGLFNVFVRHPPWVEALVWFLIAFGAVCVLAWRVRDRAFLHGFLGGVLMGTIAAAIQGALSEEYARTTGTTTNPMSGWFLFLSGTFISLVYGCVLGGATWWFARRASNVRAAPPV